MRSLKSYLTQVIRESQGHRFSDLELAIMEGGHSLELTEGTLSVDVPNEDWLQDKIDYAKSKGRNSFGVPYMGSTTASVRGTPPRVRLERLASLPGMRNEQMNVRKDDLKWLMDYMERTGKLPPMGSSPDQEYLPFIMVAYNGEAWVNEGNHRIMAAYRLNWPDMPVEIRYFDGGERVASGPMAPGKIGLGPVKEDADIKLTPDTNRVKEFVDAMYSKYPAWPMDANQRVMVWGSGEEQQFAVFELKPSFSKRNSVEVSWFAAYPLRQGVGTRAMKELQTQAREYGVGLTLFPWDKGQVSQSKLIKFYKQSGFKPIQKGGKSMAWETLEEAFDQPYKLRWEKGDYGDVDAIARMDDGNYLSIMFNKGYNQDKEEAWNVEFYRNNSQEVTGEGDAQRVFATVLSAIQTFIKKYKPNKVIFSASKEVEQGQNAQSRARLYDSLVQRYARAWGFRAFRADTGNKVIYELSRIKPIVAKSVEEARVNPEQNTKYESGMKELEAVAKTISDPENWAISMTSEPKLGINPQVGISEDTPKGIYFYPLNYAVGMIKGRRPLPWGDNYPYIQLFQYDRSGEMTQQTQVDSEKLKQALRQYCSDEIIQQALDEPEYDGTPYWTIYDCLSRLGKSDETNVVRWNKVLRDLGFTSVYDPGKGWIAYNEPTQGVVLDPRIIKQLKTIVNKQQSSVVTPAKIEQAIFDTMDIELARNRAWQAYDPDGSKLRAAAKEYAKDPKFKPYMGKPGTEEIYDKASGYGRWGAVQLGNEAWAWFKAQQAQQQPVKQESVEENFVNYQGLRPPKNVPGTNLFPGQDIVGQRVYHCTNSLEAIKKSGGLKPRRDATGEREYGRLSTDEHPFIPVIGIWFSVGKPDWPGKHCVSFVIEPTDQVYVAYANTKGLKPNVVLNPIALDRLTVEGQQDVAENFADGKGPGRAGDSQRHGIPKGATMAELEKASHAGGRKGQLARWQLNMRRGRKHANEGVVAEGGWASTATQNTVITPRTVAEIIGILKQFEASFNAWQATQALDAEIKIGQPKGSGTYYRRDLEQDPTREYGDVDVECFIHSRAGVSSAARITEYRQAIQDYCLQSPDYNTDNGTNIIMGTTDGPVQVDLIYTYHEHANWSRALSPEYRVKGAISTSLTSALAEVLNLSFSSQGIQVKIRNGQPVSFRQSKNTELRTVSTTPETWAKDIYALFYYLASGEKPESYPGGLEQHGGLKDEQRLSDIVLAIKALASALEQQALLGHASLIGIADKKDMLRKVAGAYAKKLETAENSSKFDKAATPAAEAKAKKTKLMLAKYRNEITKLLLN